MGYDGDVNKRNGLGKKNRSLGQPIGPPSFPMFGMPVFLQLPNHSGSWSLVDCLGPNSCCYNDEIPDVRPLR